MHQARSCSHCGNHASVGRILTATVIDVSDDTNSYALILLSVFLNQVRFDVTTSKHFILQGKVAALIR